MANTFGTDALIQSPDPQAAASFYVKNLGFEISDETPDLISLHGTNINLFIERGPDLGPVLEVTVANVDKPNGDSFKRAARSSRTSRPFRGAT